MSAPRAAALREVSSNVDPPEAHQWVGVPSCVRSGMKALFKQCEEQRRLLEDGRLKREQLERNAARLEQRWDALSASVEETRGLVLECRREAAAFADGAMKSASKRAEETVNELARRPSRDEVERLVATAGVGAAGDVAKRLDAAERRLRGDAARTAEAIAKGVARRDDDARKQFKKALDAQRHWLGESLGSDGAARREEAARASQSLKSCRAEVDALRLRVAVLERSAAEEPARLEAAVDRGATVALECARDAVSKMDGDGDAAATASELVLAGAAARRRPRPRASRASSSASPGRGSTRAAGPSRTGSAARRTRAGRAENRAGRRAVLPALDDAAAKLGEDLAAAQAAQTTEAASLARVAAEKVAEELNERVDGLEATAAAADVEDAQRALEAALREEHAAALAAVAKTAAEKAESTKLDFLQAAVPKKQADRSDDDDDAVEAAGESERKAFAAIAKTLRRLSHRDKETRLRLGKLDERVGDAVAAASSEFRAAHGELEERLNQTLGHRRRRRDAGADALAVAESLRGTVAACDAKLSVALKDSSATSAERAKLASDVAVAQRRLEDYGKRSAATNVAEDVAAEKRRAQDDKLLKEAEASPLGDAKFSSWPRASRPSSAAAGPRASPPRPPRTRAAAAAAADISKRGKKRADEDRHKYDAVQDAATLTRLTQSTLEVLDAAKRDGPAPAAGAYAPPPPPPATDLAAQALNVMEQAQEELAKKWDASQRGALDDAAARDARVSALQTVAADLQRRYANLANNVASLFDRARDDAAAPPPPPPPPPPPADAAPAEAPRDAIESINTQLDRGDNSSEEETARVPLRLDALLEGLPP
ncbi:hypothetical protein JL720_13620 [Aureococcus anophagefferens]|nr:hypothetical protein JL720_13620 [Aureococcus anophagefferens]